MLEKKQFYSTTEVAKILGISSVAVHKRIKTGKIQAEKVGRNYVIPQSEIAGLIGGEITSSQKKLIDAAVKRTITDYGETLQMLAHS
ncbi:MAG: helix-turn-helix domain-containing protein [Patescibacteria group bacterium]|nr:helix-turn-helix domain-containing protein [Patescibacteria group bacterium]